MLSQGLVIRQRQGSHFGWPLVMGSLIWMGSGCSVYMAATQPGEKDLAVLKEGTPRSHIIAALGAPIWSGEKEGNKVDVFRFTQGYSKGAKAGRAIFHAVADVFTLGLWEVIGTPVESVASGDEMRIEVTYDADERVKTTQVIGLKGEKPPGNEPSQLEQNKPSP